MAFVHRVLNSSLVEKAHLDQVCLNLPSRSCTRLVLIWTIWHKDRRNWQLVLIVFWNESLRLLHTSDASAITSARTFTLEHKRLKQGGLYLALTIALTFCRFTLEDFWHKRNRKRKTSPRKTKFSFFLRLRLRLRFSRFTLDFFVLRLRLRLRLRR